MSFSETMQGLGSCEGEGVKPMRKPRLTELGFYCLVGFLGSEHRKRERG